MNPTIYRQYDSRWGSLPYPGKGSKLSDSGCGCFAVLHCAIELDKYKNLTPQECRKYMVQYATVKNGTLWAGITKGLQHYGYKVHWNQNDGMTTIFKELENSCKKGVILFVNGKAPNGTVWTTGGHYVAYTDFRIREGRHEFYCKDSGPRKHDGWYSYEKSMKGCIRNVWICKSADDKPAPAPTPPAPVGKLTVDGVGGAKTVRRTQEFLKCAVVDGVIGGQLRKHEVLFPALKSVSFGKGGSNCIYKLQQWLGLSGPDGYLGPNTTKAWQRKLRDLGYLAKNESIDGVIGSKTMKAWQECLNNDGKPKTKPTPTPTKNKLVAKADEYCWPYGTSSSKYSYSKGSAKSAYKTALKKYMGKSAKVSQTDCGYFVSTCVRAAGLGSKFLALPGKPSDKYPAVPSTMKIVHSGKAIPSGFLKAGDIIRYRKSSGQHTMIYYGDGKIAEAQRSNNFPAIKKDTKKYNASNVKKATIQVIRAK